MNFFGIIRRVMSADDLHAHAHDHASDDRRGDRKFTPGDRPVEIRVVCSNWLIWGLTPEHYSSESLEKVMQELFDEYDADSQCEVELRIGLKDFDGYHRVVLYHNELQETNWPALEEYLISLSQNQVEFDPEQIWDCLFPRVERPRAELYDYGVGETNDRIGRVFTISDWNTLMSMKHNHRQIWSALFVGRSDIFA